MTVMVVTFDEVTSLPRREGVKFLDEREVCPLVSRYAQGGKWAEYTERRECSSYFVGICSRAGARAVGDSARVNCAFQDSAFDWHKAADWQPMMGGGMLYAPEQNAWRLRQARRHNGNGKR